jgi:hypothetical protein
MRTAIHRSGVDKIALTVRGKHCRTHIFDRFFYLQLIVDDPLLPIPRALLDEFRFSHKPDDYGYIVELTGRAFRERARAMVARKATQVLLFLRVLQESVKHEEECYRECIKELRLHKVEIPAPYQISQGVMRELRAISEELQMDVSRIQETASESFVQIANSIENAYDDIHARP